MYIIKLNHLIKIYIDLIYYLKQRYIEYIADWLAGLVMCLVTPG